MKTDITGPLGGGRTRKSHLLAPVLSMMSGARSCTKSEGG